MRKYIYLLLILLLLPVTSHAWPSGILSGGIGGATASPCPSGTNYLSAWNGEYTADTDKICYPGSTKANQKDGTATGAVLGTDYGRTGTGLLADAADERLLWDVSTNDIIRGDVGTVCFDAYINVAEVSGTAQLFEATSGACGAGSSHAYVFMRSTGVIRGQYQGGSTAQIVTTTEAITPQTWVTIKYTYDGPNNTHKICIDATCVEEADALDDGAADAFTEMSVGEYRCNQGVNHPVWIDNLRVYTTYNATCE